MIDSSDRKLDETELDHVNGAGAEGHWDHSGKVSMWLTPVPGDAHGVFKQEYDRSSIRRDSNGTALRWDRATNREVPAPRLR